PLGRDGKLIERWNGPYTITEVVAPGVYRLSELDGTPVRSVVSGSQLKFYFARHERPARTPLENLRAVVVTRVVPD
ncbi:hypothetical protein IWW50_002253, partial [Coemansia erecta]